MDSNVPESNCFAYLPLYGGNMLPATRVYGFGFLHFIPCAPPSSGGWSGDVGEDCLSA